jgi:hypothetical protein
VIVRIEHLKVARKSFVAQQGGKPSNKSGRRQLVPDQVREATGEVCLVDSELTAMSKYDELKEQALINLDLLLNYWQVEYEQITSKEYDIKAVWRNDDNLGSCRFNVEKGRGADFAASGLAAEDCTQLGAAFTKDDFHDPNRFDVIGLCQLVNGLNSRAEAADTLTLHLAELDKVYQFKKATRQEIEERLKLRQQARERNRWYATKTWKLAQRFEGTIGDKYLRSRGISINGEPNIKFLHRVHNKELNDFFPCLIFKVSQWPDSDLAAIHRIYLDRAGNKLRCENPKIALGSVAGNAIWLGTPGEQLCIAEGPENALSIRCLGYSFVASSVNASNFSGLVIPGYVKEIILFPDADAAGRANAEKAVQKYKRFQTKVCFPPSGGDWNDALNGRLY